MLDPEAREWSKGVGSWVAMAVSRSWEIGTQFYITCKTSGTSSPTAHVYQGHGLLLELSKLALATIRSLRLLTSDSNHHTTSPTSRTTLSSSCTSIKLNERRKDIINLLKQPNMQQCKPGAKFTPSSFLTNPTLLARILLSQKGLHILILTRVNLPIQRLFGRTLRPNRLLNNRFRLLVSTHSAHDSAGY
jgi:hypothetical protein